MTQKKILDIYNDYLFFLSPYFDTVYQEIFTPVLFFPLLPLLSMGEFRLDEFQCLIISPFKHNCFWVNSKRGKTVCKCSRAKITGGKKNLCIQYYQLHLCPISLLNRCTKSTKNIPKHCLITCLTCYS